MFNESLLQSFESSLDVYNPYYDDILDLITEIRKLQNLYKMETVRCHDALRDKKLIILENEKLEKEANWLAYTLAQTGIQDGNCQCCTMFRQIKTHMELLEKCRECWRNEAKERTK